MPRFYILIRKGTKVPEFQNVKDLGDFVLYYLFYQMDTFTTVTFPDLVTITGNSAMGNSFAYSKIEAITFPKLSSITGARGLDQTFQDCSNLTAITFPSLTTISGNSAIYAAFYNCKNLTSIAFPELTTVTGPYALRAAFSYCGLTNVVFPKLNNLIASQAFNEAFYSCKSLVSLSFPALKSDSFGTRATDQFKNMLSGGVTGCIVHFPSNLQSVIGSWSDITNGFGGTNTTVLFDLPATS